MDGPLLHLKIETYVTMGTQTPSLESGYEDIDVLVRAAGCPKSTIDSKPLLARHK